MFFNIIHGNRGVINCCDVFVLPIVSRYFLYIMYTESESKTRGKQGSFSFVYILSKWMISVQPTFFCYYRRKRKLLIYPNYRFSQWLVQNLYNINVFSRTEKNSLNHTCVYDRTKNKLIQSLTNVSKIFTKWT